MATASEFSNSSTVNRTILVTDIPYETDDIEDLKDKLDIHFGRRKNGGGDVETIICPFGGSMAKALIVFESESVITTVLNHKHQLGNQPIQVHRLPPVLAEVTGYIDDFYSSVLPRDKLGKLTSRLSQEFGQAKVKRTRGKLTEVTGTIDQLKEVENIMGETLRLVAKDSSLDMSEISERGVTIENIPYMTDDNEQLKDELSVHVKQVIGAELELVLCPIQGSLQRAIAVFKSTEERNLYNRHGDHQFLGNLLQVEELPRVFKEVTATFDAFYMKSIPKIKMNKITSLMQDKMGLKFTEDSKRFSGTLKQIHQAEIYFTDIFGLPQRSDQSHSPIIDRNEGSGKSQDMEKEATKSSAEDSVRNASHDGMEIDASIQSKDNSQDGAKVVAVVDKQETYRSGKSKNDVYDDHLDNRNRETNARVRTAQVTTSATRSRETKESTLSADVKRSVENADEDSNLIEPDENHFSHPYDASNYSDHDQPMIPSARKTAEANSNNTTVNLSAEVPSSGAVGPQSRFSESFIPVDQMMFKYMKVHHRSALEDLEKKHSVKIKMGASDPANPNNILVELKARCMRNKKGKQNTDIFEAQEEFNQLYYNISRNTIKEIVPIDEVDNDQLKMVQENLKKKFPNVEVAWNKETECTLCGDKTTVENAAQELSNSISCYESLSVDKIAFEYLSTVNKNELDAIKKKYKITLEIQEVASKDDNQEAVYFRPYKPWKSKCSLDNLHKAKEEFISLYQDTYFSVRRIPIKCQDISERAIAAAVKGTKKVYPNIHTISGRNTNEIIICAAEGEADDAIREFRTLAGLLPNRRLRRPTSDNTDQTSQSSHHRADSLTTNRNEGNGQPPLLRNSQISPSVFVTAEGLEIIVVSGDITKQRTDVIVSSANCYLTHDGGVSKAIADAAGPELQRECKDLLRGTYLQVGECVETRPFGLKCRRVVHAVGPRYQGDIMKFSSLLTKTFSTALVRIDTVICAQSVAMPLISSGTHSGPKQCCADALATALHEFSQKQTEKNLKQVLLVNKDDETTRILHQTCSNMFRQIFESTTGNNETVTTSSAQYKTSKGLDVIIETGDITKARASVIVNAANKDLRHARGVAGAISKAAGKELQEECKRIMKNRKPLQTAECLVTDGYNLQCKVLHTVGPIYDKYSSDKEFFQDLKNTFLSALKYANLPIETKDIAVPLISSGIYGGPKQLCAKALLAAVEEFNMEPTLVIERIRLVNVDEAATYALQCEFSKLQSGKVRAMSAEIEPQAGLKQYKTMRGIVIYVEEGDITKQVVDAIVNPTREDLQHQVGVAKAVSSAAGRKLQERCNYIMKERKGAKLHIGEVIPTEGYGLKCKHVLHTPSPSFIKGESKSHKRIYHETLTTVFQRCLYVANSTICTKSIAIPLIGAGNNDAPKTLCADALVKAINMFDEREDRALYLEKIVIVSIDQEAIFSIRRALNDNFTTHSNKVNDGQSNAKPTVFPRQTFQTDEGILVVNQLGDITTQKADAMINCTDDKLKNTDGLSVIISKAAGPNFQRECNKYISNCTRPLKSGDIITTKGHQLGSTDVLHITEPRSADIETSLVQILSYADKELAAKSITLPLIGRSEEPSVSFCARAMGHSIQRFSQAGRSIKEIHFVNADDLAFTELGNTFSSMFKPISVSVKASASQNSHQSNTQTWSDDFPEMKQNTRQTQGAVPKKIQNQEVGHYEDDSQPQQTGYLSSLVEPVMNVFGFGGSSKTANLPLDTTQQSHIKERYSSSGVQTPSERKQSLDVKGQVIKKHTVCSKCYVDHDVKMLESCGHTFCSRCIIQFIAPASHCLNCHALYCVVRNRIPPGTMTYYTRTNLTLPGESGSGAVVVDYEFPDGTVEERGQYHGRHFKGNRFQAYLPNTSEGIETVWLLRTAFIANLTFTVKPRKSGVLEVTWSGVISHKHNIKGGIGNHGYPDPDYLAKVKKELKKHRIVSSLSSDFETAV